MTALAVAPFKARSQSHRQSKASSQAGAESLQALYQGHHWFALKDALCVQQGTALMRGAVAVAFRDGEAAKRELENVLADPLATPEDKADAQTWLGYYFMQSGAFAQAAPHIEANDANSPLAAVFRNVGDQHLIDFTPAKIPYTISARKMFLPMTLNGSACNFILDSDANFSFIAESEAQRLGLKITDTAAETTGALGKGAKIRSAVVDDLVIGGLHLQNVAFMVLADEGSLFPTLPEGSKGAVGLPVFLAMRTAHWDRTGTFCIGYPVGRSATPARLGFDGCDPIVEFTFGGRTADALLDLGAEHSVLWPPFAARFPEALKGGRNGLATVKGFGGSAQLKETIAPSLELAFGDRRLTMAPAHVLRQKTTANSGWYNGRLGLDLLLQASSVAFDLETLRLSLD